jgi:hypothetical protein
MGKQKDREQNADHLQGRIGNEWSLAERTFLSFAPIGESDKDKGCEKQGNRDRKRHEWTRSCGRGPF